MNRITTLDPRAVASPDRSDVALAASRPSVRPTRLPVGRDLVIGYRLSVAVAVLVGGVSAAGLALGPTGVYGFDAAIAAEIATSTAGILVPGFFAHDLFPSALRTWAGTIEATRPTPRLRSSVFTAAPGPATTCFPSTGFCLTRPSPETACDG